MVDPETAGITAARKLDQFFKTLSPGEQKAISEMVRHSLMYASQQFMEDPKYYEDRMIPPFVMGITGANAPLLVKSLGFPGNLRAHGIPSCASSALAALASIEAAKSKTNPE